MIHGIAFAFTYMNIPRAANQSVQYDSPAFFGVSNQHLALLTAFMLGLGDAGVNNVIYTSISSIWSTDSASAFALMKEWFGIFILLLLYQDIMHTLISVSKVQLVQLALLAQRGLIFT